MVQEKIELSPSRDHCGDVTILIEKERALAFEKVTEAELSGVHFSPLYLAVAFRAARDLCVRDLIPMEHRPNTLQVQENLIFHRPMKIGCSLIANTRVEGIELRKPNSVVCLVTEAVDSDGLLTASETFYLYVKNWNPSVQQRETHSLTQRLQVLDNGTVDWVIDSELGPTISDDFMSMVGGAFVGESFAAASKQVHSSRPSGNDEVALPALVHGVCGISIIIHRLLRQSNQRTASLGQVNTRFHNPVFAGDRLRTSVRKVRSAAEGNSIFEFIAFATERKVYSGRIVLNNADRGDPSIDNHPVAQSYSDR